MRAVRLVAGFALIILAVAPTPPAGAQGLLSIDTGSSGPAISPLVRGVNMVNWYDITQAGIASALIGAGIRTVRWPGGSNSDLFDWQLNRACDFAYVNPNSTFDAFVADVAKPAHLRMMITLNYGTDAACLGPGDPNVAAAWVDHAIAIGAPVDGWTVGNEVYGKWEPDMHAKPHDAATYANAVATGYYPLIKSRHPHQQVGVVVNPGAQPYWDAYVLANAKYDFVEMHYYAQDSDKENDAGLMRLGTNRLVDLVKVLQSELATANHAGTPIFLGELGSVAPYAGKQTISITQALYAGEALAELMQVGGVQHATWWLGFGGCANPTVGGNWSSWLYGWQYFGGFMIFSDGLPEHGCLAAPPMAVGVPLPTARTLSLIGDVALPGERMLTATLSDTPLTVRAYAMTHRGGYAAALFNLNETASATLSVSLTGLTRGSAAVSYYDKAIYDLSKSGEWAGPNTRSLGTWSGTIPVTLPPWSMTVLTVKP